MSLSSTHNNPKDEKQGKSNRHVISFSKDMFISFFDCCYYVHKSAYSRELFRAVNTHSGVADF